MNNFIFENKTKVSFGKGGVKEYLGGIYYFLEKRKLESLHGLDVVCC